MKDYEVQYLEVDTGEVLAYRATGKGEKTFLLIHGNMSSSVHWANLMELLEDNYKVYALDLPGFGDSTYNRSLDSLNDFAQDVKSFILKLDLNNLIIAGWSTGGGVTLELAAMEELKNRIEKIILIESVGVQGYPIMRKDEEGYIIEGDFLLEKDEIALDAVQVLPVLDAYENNNRDYMKALWNSVIYNLNQPVEEDYELYLDAIMKQRNLVDVDYSLVHFNITNDNTAYNEGRGIIDNIDVPILMIHSEKDLVVPISEAIKSKEYLGDKAELVTLEDIGHSPLTDDSVLLYDKIMEFVN